MKFGLKDETILQINKIFAKYSDVEKVILYGSRAKGNFKNGSDIDLTIVGNISDKEYSKIELELDDLMLPYMIDLSLIAQIDNKDLLEHIDRVGVVFYGRGYG